MRPPDAGASDVSVSSYTSPTAVAAFASLAICLVVELVAIAVVVFVLVDSVLFVSVAVG